ncbi:MAG: hypothetical protein N4A50_10475 [Vallitalea sp.]|jgi:hypothetical protein|nr:hypothetical protein [Vallitalea sp.]
MKSKLLKYGSIIPPIIIVVSVVFSLIAKNLLNIHADVPVALQVPMIIWIVVLILSVILVYVFMIGYIIHIIVYNKTLSGRAKLRWSLMIWFLNVFAIPIYWHKYIDRDNNDTIMSSLQVSEDNVI